MTSITESAVSILLSKIHGTGLQLKLRQYPGHAPRNSWCASITLTDESAGYLNEKHPDIETKAIGLMAYGENPEQALTMLVTMEGLDDLVEEWSF